MLKELNQVSQSTNPYEQRLVDLEIRLTYQQKLIDELNSVVTEQTMTLLKLEKSIGTLVEHHDQLQRQLREQSSNLPHERPPHY